MISPHPIETAGIPRHKMPQVDPESLVGIPTISLDPGVLRSTQSDFSDEKIRSIASTIESSGNALTPIVISSDFYVLDGHHRWLAHALLKRKVEAVQLDLPRDQAIGLLIRMQGKSNERT